MYAQAIVNGSLTPLGDRRPCVRMKSARQAGRLGRCQILDGPIGVHDEFHVIL